VSLFDKFKLIKGSKKAKTKERAMPKEKKEPAKEIKPKTEPVKLPSRKKDLKEVYRILKEPHISEKATFLSDNGKYVFKVFFHTNKIQIKNAVENLYGVNVENVKVINIKAKTRTMRNISGHKAGYKKAIITLQKGQKIEILPH